MFRYGNFNTVILRGQIGKHARREKFKNATKKF